ncbi:MAG: hypothetical protein KDE51_25140, partial [Anaerolineales bacterium]|nr:hypothetical protein [Anaerolineales bacterium]
MSKIVRFLLVSGLYLWPLLLLGLPIADTAAAAGDIYIVDSRRDEPDANPGDGQCRTSFNRCTFRAAIDEANAQIGPNEIHFNVRNNNGSCPSSAIIIEGESQYFTDLADDKRGSYVITDDKLIIDGYTQCQAKANTEQVAGNAVIRIQITPQGSNGYGLVLNANRNLIRGLSIYGWTRSVEFRDASHNTFSGNFVGMKANGDDGNGSTGIRINYGSAHNTIGGPTPAERNILSGNGFEALDIQGAGVEQNHIINNYIGVKQNGTSKLSNNGDAVDIAEEASSNWVGGILLDEFNRPILDGNGRYMADPNKRNIISGNAQDGIEISHNL